MMKNLFKNMRYERSLKVNDQFIVSEKRFYEIINAASYNTLSFRQVTIENSVVVRNINSNNTFKYLPDLYVTKITVSSRGDKIHVFMYDRMTWEEDTNRKTCITSVPSKSASDERLGTLVIFSKKELKDVPGDNYFEKVLHSKLYNDLLNHQAKCDIMENLYADNELADRINLSQEHVKVDLSDIPAMCRV